MADSSSSISFDASGLRHVRSSLFNLPGFVMGFTKGLSSHGEPVRSPTSTLGFELFSISDPFRVGYKRSSYQDKQWHHFGIGLGIVNSLVDETEENGSFERKNIVFGLEVKASFLKRKLKSHSLPKNYVISPHSETNNSKIESIYLDSLSDEKRVRVSFGSKSLTSIINTLSESNMYFSSSLRNEKFVMKNKALLTSRDLEVDSPLEIVQNSVPLPIECSRRYARSLSARDIELSEDYTCITSHGPNPKTTHIFGDCILECHTNELSFANEKDQPESITKSPNTSMLSRESASDPSGKVLHACYSCKKKIEEGTRIYKYSDEVFCSFACRSEEIIAEAELNQTDINFSESCSNSNYNEDLFPMGLPIDI